MDPEVIDTQGDIAANSEMWVDPGQKNDPK